MKGEGCWLGLVEGVNSSQMNSLVRRGEFSSYFVALAHGILEYKSDLFHFHLWRDYYFVLSLCEFLITIKILLSVKTEQHKKLKFPEFPLISQLSHAENKTREYAQVGSLHFNDLKSYFVHSSFAQHLVTSCFFSLIKS